MNNDKNIIDASPTKEFFIYMLTKDLDIACAISDLVDNSIDGAKRLKQLDDYNGLYVHLEVNKDYFEIKDNCGGIPIDVAQKYAFRFGRPSDMPKTNYSIGRFGVGMKRALFKLGNFFRIESITENSRFVVEQDIKEWAANSNEWDFVFKELEENFTPEKNTTTGTSIRVEQLYPGITDEFSLENYITKLKNELEKEHQLSLKRGLKIEINNISLRHTAPKLLSSEYIVPAYKTNIYPVNTQEESGEVKVKIYAGMAERNPNLAGWYIFCNERLVLKADKSVTTGWSEPGISNFHNDFARFRGFVFFDSTQPELLPWNTTKNNVDLDSQLYRGVRREIIQTMKPVVNFLKKVAKEKKDNGEDTTPLEELMENASTSSLDRIEENSTFKFDSKIASPEPKEQSSKISYHKPTFEVEKIKNMLEVRTFKEVGEKTFEYFLNMEGDED